MRRWTRSVAVVVASVLVVAACGDDDEAGTPSATEGSGETDESASSAATDGTGGGADSGETGECPAGSEDTLTFGVRNEPQGLDPYVSGSTGAQSGSERTALFDTLMQFDPDNGEFVPRMAESLEPNDDFTEWTLTLRDGVAFGNGEPVDTAAVEFTVDRHRAEDSTSLMKSTASLVESMEIVDDLTMVFHLESPYGNFPSLLAGPVGMVIHADTFEELGDEDFAADPQGGGAGPYQLEHWAPGEELVLQARDDYWGGEVCVDTIRFTYGLDDVARYDAFELGELDVAFLRSPEQIAQAEADGVAMHTNIANGGFMIQMNHGARGSDRPTADLRVRRAVAYAIDAEFIDDRAFGGEGLPDTALVPESSPLYMPELEGPPHDPDQARELLDEAKADGYDGSIHFLCNDTYDEAAIAITALLEDAGFQVELDSSMSVQEWAERLLETDYDIACGSAAGSDARPWDSMSFHFSGVASEGSLTGYESPAMVEAMTALKEAGTLEEQQEAFAGVHDVWNDEIPSAIYGHTAEVLIWRDGVEELGFTNDLVAVFDQVRING